MRTGIVPLDQIAKVFLFTEDFFAGHDRASGLI